MQVSNQDEPTPVQTGTSNLKGLIILLVVIALLVTTSAVTSRSSTARANDDYVQLNLDATLKARNLFLRQQVKAPSSSDKVMSAEIIGDLSKIANGTRSRRAIRQLAIVQHWLLDPRWSQTLLMLRTARPDKSDQEVISAFSIERELSWWGLVLACHPQSQDIATFRTLFARNQLGWFEHLALESAYRNGSMQNEANRESQLAGASSIRLVLFQWVALLSMVAGFGLLIMLYFYLDWRKKNPDVVLKSPWNNILSVNHPVPLSDEKAALLYSMFLSYLVSFAAIRGIGTFVLMPIVTALPPEMAKPIGAVITGIASLLPPIVPFIIFIRNRKEVDLKAADFGWHIKEFWANAACGIMGYLCMLPLLIVASVVSNLLFRNLLSPSNPAITVFAGSRETYLIALIVIQAAILAPLVEETMFRGVFFNSISRRYGQIGALVLSSAVFSVLHPQLPLGFLGLFTIGAVFTQLFRFKNSLVPGIIAHALNNGLIFVYLALVTGQ